MSQIPRLHAPQPDDLTVGNVTVGAVSLSRFNWRLATALFLAGILWIGPYVGSVGVVMPALVAEVAPEERVGLVATMGLAGAFLSLLSNIVFGALSDLTRSPIGARAPWILLGSVGTSIGLWGLHSATTTTTLVVWWCVYMLFLNAIIAPMVAVISDRVPSKYRGTVSSIYGVGMVLGASIGQIVGAGFVSDPTVGIQVFAVVSLVSGVFFVVVAPEKSNRAEARAKLSGRRLLHSFALPRRGSRDFYLALFGKFALIAGMYAITNYQLYILIDHIGLDQGGAAGIIAIMAGIQLVTALVFGLGSGPLSDRLGRRKPFIIVAALLVGVGILVPFLAPFAWGMIVFSVLAGIGNGVFTSVDQALNIEVLPDPKTAAKDLGLLNMANSGGQMLGPVVTSLVVATTGGYQLAFVAAFVLLVISAILIVPIRSVR
ncbi:MFS transporter [Rathayibacter sp. VKM Ac-2803]|uniref:MFS transporter n=1 Tax=unclassified Rathayibacter TaxID=2609250 RepID=UPI00135C3923|nr:MULTISPECIES: MFS transporter [unclassified Rathayibacter]MWV48892.1 MFS transporter [Rathayibacter sp. VKM Ac-2803]MWV58619.1 MFS transporter [Rathayibacter sp. VKM Ac-2754]